MAPAVALDEPLLSEQTSSWVLSGLSGTSESPPSGAARPHKGAAGRGGASVKFDLRPAAAWEYDRCTESDGEDDDFIGEASPARSPSSPSGLVGALGGVEVVEQSLEWGELDTRDSSRASPLQRLDRYQRFAAELDGARAEAASGDSETPLAASISGLWRSSLRFRALESLHYFVDITLKSAFLLMEVFAWHEISPLTNFFLFLLLAFEKLVIGYLAFTDHRLARLQRRLWFVGSYLRWLGVYAFVLVFLVLLQGYDLLLVFESWFGSEKGGIRNVKMSLSLYDDNDKERKQSVRLDSHWRTICCTPFTFYLLSLVLQTRNPPHRVFLMYSALVSSLMTIVVGSLNFDYLASRHIRLMYASARRFAFILAHLLIRVVEILARLAVLMVPWIAFSRWRGAYYAAGMCDWLLGCVALCYSGRGRREVQGICGTLSLIALGAPLWLYDVSRYVDETGVAMSARRLSGYLMRLRTLQFIGAFALAAADLLRDHMPSAVAGSIDRGCGRLLLPLFFLHLAFHLLRGCSIAGRPGHDLFTAAEAGDTERVRRLLQSRVDPDGKTRDSYESTALHIAAANDRLDVADYLVRTAAAHLDEIDAEGETALHVSCRTGSLDIAELIMEEIESRSAPNTPGQRWIRVHRNNRGKTPLQVMPRAATASRLAALLEQDEKTASSCGMGRRSSRGLFIEQARAEDVELLFGPAVGSEPSRFFGLAPGAGGQKRGPGIASYMFQTGVGDGLGKVLDSVSERAVGHKVKLESLRKLNVIGAGGFGRVIKVLDVRTDTNYALKLQKRDSTTKQAIREARALHSHKHAFVVTLFRIFCTENYFCLLLELCSRDLNVRILENRSADGRALGLPNEDVARYAACITLALEFVHDQRIIFRDLKPENILISHTESSPGHRGCDHAKLADFGLARSVRKAVEELESSCASPQTIYEVSPNTTTHMMSMASPSQQITSMAGTMAFMPSEALDGAQFQSSWPAQFKMQWLTSRDWYAFGCCLFLMLLGEAGGRSVTVGGRTVLLPPAGEGIMQALRTAVRQHRLDAEAYDLTALLTMAGVAERGGAADVRASPFMRDGIAEMDKVRLEADQRRHSSEAGFKSRLARSLTMPCLRQPCG